MPETKTKRKRTRLKKDEMLLVEKHVIKRDNVYFDMLKNFMHLSKNLFNYTLYAWRQAFIKKDEYLSYEDLYKYAKNGVDYKNMPTAQSAQQTIKRMHEACKGFETLNENYKEDPSKYSGKPNLPKYLNKQGFYTLTLTNQNCKLISNEIAFPRVFKGFRVKTKCFKHKGFESLQQVRMSLKGCKHQRIILEIVFKVKKEEKELDYKRYCGIDLGVENFAALAFNFKSSPLLVKGAPIKSINQYFNKKIAFYASRAKKCQDKNCTRRIERLWEKRKNKINDFFHKTAKKIIFHCLEHRVGMIVIGKNKGWKQHKKRMQNFVYIPYNRFIEILKYKAALCGIKVHVISERYTSGTSFLDGELPKKVFYDKTRRVERGLFISNKGKYVNADINAALQIIRKYVNTYKSKADSNKLFDRHDTWHDIVNNIKKIV